MILRFSNSANEMNAKQLFCMTPSKIQKGFEVPKWYPHFFREKSQPIQNHLQLIPNIPNEDLSP